MGLTIGILVVTGVVTVAVMIFVFKFAMGSMGDKKTLETGVPGSALVMSLSPTGTVINDMYYVCNIGLRVSLPAQAPYDVIIKQSVPITAMARVNPGASVGVKVDPTDNTKVVIDWNAPAALPGQMGPMGGAPMVADPSAAQLAAAVATASAAGAMGQTGMEISPSTELLRSGQRVLGVLTEFADTGNTPRSLGVTPSRPEFIDDPMYAITLQLHVASGTQIEAKVIHRVPRAMVPQLHLGLELNCAVDPANPSRNIAVDWGDIPL